MLGTLIKQIENSDEIFNSVKNAFKYSYYYCENVINRF